jgi:hypothetical protein
MNDTRLMWSVRATFSRFVSALNRRDRYELELDDVARPVSLERREVLSQRLEKLNSEIQQHESDLTRMTRKLAAFEDAA